MWRKKQSILKRDPSLTASTSTSSQDLNVDKGTEQKIEASTSNKGENKSDKRKIECDEDGSEYMKRKHKFIRTTIRTDYQPDICKDYKETGFCGFGDSCKFLHDRSDYKHGWQLEQEWAKGQYEDEDDDKYLIKDDGDGDDDDNSDKHLTHCAICDEPYKDPIITKCKHYFCIDCAEKECSDNCYSCQQPTSGIFKNAKKLLEAAKSKNNI